jgi:sterol desaturase/sphingolipid hydroxylase (fatty acid hydroxylase superfamily)
MLSAALQVLAAYILVDLLTGLYHLVTDNGLNFRRQVEIFAEHHVINTMEVFDWQPSVVGLPAMLLGLVLLNPFLVAAGAFGILGQVPHYYAHRRSRSDLVHHVVRILQLTGIIISPQHHRAHHDGKFNRNFCIVSGWNNYWLNPLIALFDRPALSKEH